MKGPCTPCTTPAALTRIGCLCAMSCALACVCAPLRAQTSTFNGAVALSSQLVDRGLAITPATPILQAAASWTSASGWSAGVSGALQTRDPGHLSEGLAQVSRAWSLSSAWQMQADLLYYDYPGNERARLFDRTEAGIDWIYRDVLTVGLSATSMTHGADHQPRGAADVDFHWPLAGHFSLALGAGVAQYLVSPYDSYGYVHRPPPGVYGYGHAGLFWSHGAWRIELDRIATDPAVTRHGGNLVAQPWVGTVSWSF
ncbi:MAG TPA: hypothetical protein VME63_14980 [Dyella sp.]|uniref:hypothetical protein n=1 Tax=Dyella sp. TaxID=1869338 RepID=UPI002CAEA219|nr:hypothetical protein [Dyella sp.]HTV86701.1 hypothetical protein [Dyella sp.]